MLTLAMDFVRYDLLLGLCGSDTEGNRKGFSCGAYTTNESLYGESITVQLILTNDNLVEENPTYVVCAEVECTFHAPVVTQ